MSSQAGKHHQSQPQQPQQQPPSSQHHQHHPQQQHQQHHHSQHQPQQQQPGNNQPQQHSQRYDTGAHHQSGASPNAGGGADAATSSGTAPNVRHIPIYVEGRDEPLINRNIDTKPSAHHVHRSASGSGSSNSANFDWARKVPTMGGHQSAPPQPQQQPQHDPMRAHSPHRTSKPVHRSGSAGANNSTAGAQHSQQQQQQQHSPGTPSRQQPDSGTMPANGGAKANAADYMSITKIQNIQRDVLNLMDQVERFNGTTRKDRQYMYLDEMLTQNLLKLDTIDTDGKENIKMARREAIRCINKCIGVLEAKADAGAQQAKQAADTAASKNAASRV